MLGMPNGLVREGWVLYGHPRDGNVRVAQSASGSHRVRRVPRDAFVWDAQGAGAGCETDAGSTGSERDKASVGWIPGGSRGWTATKGRPGLTVTPKGRVKSGRPGPTGTLGPTGLPRDASERVTPHRMRVRATASERDGPLRLQDASARDAPSPEALEGYAPQRHGLRGTRSGRVRDGRQLREDGRVREAPQREGRPADRTPGCRCQWPWRPNLLSLAARCD